MPNDNRKKSEKVIFRQQIVSWNRNHGRSKSIACRGEKREKTKQLQTRHVLLLGPCCGNPRVFHADNKHTGGLVRERELKAEGASDEQSRCLWHSIRWYIFQLSGLRTSLDCVELLPLSAYPWIKFAF